MLTYLPDSYHDTQDAWTTQSAGAYILLLVLTVWLDLELFSRRYKRRKG
jgi:hypothetical protein